MVIKINKIIVLIITVISVISLGLFIGCSTDLKYSLLLSISPVNSGTVSLNPSNGSYLKDTEVTLTPTPVTGNSFKKWTGNNASDINNSKLIMNSDKSIIAAFDKDFTGTWKYTGTADTWTLTLTTTTYEEIWTGNINFSSRGTCTVSGSNLTMVRKEFYDDTTKTWNPVSNYTMPGTYSYNNNVLTLGVSAQTFNLNFISYP